MKLRDVKVGIIIDREVYVPAPMQPACRGCDLLKRCDGGRDLLCEFVDRITGKNNLLKEFKEE